MNAPSRPGIVVARDIEQALKDQAECAPEVRRLLVEAAKVLSQIPNHEDLIPQTGVLTVTEIAVWMGWMPFGEPVKSRVYNTATERVRGLIQRGELPARVIGGKSYVVSGLSFREFLDRRNEPIRAKDAA
jgi:hypothetical protein